MHSYREPKVVPARAYPCPSPRAAMSVEPQMLRRRRTALRLPPLLFDDAFRSLLSNQVCRGGLDGGESITVARGGLDGGESITVARGGLDGGESITVARGGLDGGESITVLRGGLDGGESITVARGGLDGGESIMAKAEPAIAQPATKATRLTFIMIPPNKLLIGATIRRGAKSAPRASNSDAGN